MADEAWTHPDGAIRILDEGKGRSLLAEVQHCTTGASDRYGAYYIQFPERGERCGGSGWTYGAECFRPPQSPTEFVWLMQYTAARRVRELRLALIEAEQDSAAVNRYAVLLGQATAGA